MLLLSWNVNHWNQKADLPERIEAIGSKRPDIVTLQEVKSNLADAWQDQLAKAGLVHTYWSGKGVPSTPYEYLIASRWPVSNGDDRWRRYAPYPESLGRATVSVPGGDVDVFTAHIPNGSGNGWKKIDTFRVLSAALRRAIGSGSSMDRLTLCCRGLAIPNLGRGNVRGCGQLAFGAVKPDRKSTRVWNEIRVALSESDE